jgi:GR25 family glycosyltransferase involved in LPS biosynthesis
MYKTYVISLNKPDKLLSEISNYGLSPILVEGVNGKKLSTEEIKDNTSSFGSLFTPLNVIGIAMAHIKVWKLFLESGAKYGIIFEDDVVFEDNFRKELDLGINNTPKDFDILYLGCFGCQNYINFHTMLFANTGLINKNPGYINDYVNKPIVAFATHAYVISRKGAKKLLKYIEHNIYTHIDLNMQTLSSNNLLDTYSLNNRLVYQTSTDETQSLNVSSSHPIILNNILSEYYIDTKVKASYGSTVSLFKVGKFNFNPSSLLFIILGVILSATSIDIFTLTGIYILISLPDLYMDLNNTAIKIHYLLLIISYLIFREFNISNKINN